MKGGSSGSALGTVTSFGQTDKAKKKHKKFSVRIAWTPNL